MDAQPGDNRPNLADSLPDHPPQFRVRVRAGVPGQGRLEGCRAIRHQPRRQLTLHANFLRVAERAAGGSEHSDRVGHDHLVCVRHLARL